MYKNILSIFIVFFLFFAMPLYVRAEQQKLPATLKGAMKLDENGRYGDAVAAIEQLISRNKQSDNMRAYLSLGLVHFRNGNNEAALNGFSKSVEIKKENPMAYYFMGMIYEKKALGTSKPDLVKEMKTKSLESWQNYIKYAGSKKIIPSEAHRNIGISVQEGIKRAKNHIDILQGLNEQN